LGDKLQVVALVLPLALAPIEPYLDGVIADLARGDDDVTLVAPYTPKRRAASGWQS